MLLIKSIGDMDFTKTIRHRIGRLHENWKDRQFEAPALFVIRRLLSSIGFAWSTAPLSRNFDEELDFELLADQDVHILTRVNSALGSESCTYLFAHVCLCF